MVSVEGNSQRGVSSAAAIAIVYESVKTPAMGILLLTVVRSCGSDRAEACGKNILPYIDQSLEDFRRRSPDLWQNVRVN